MAVSGRFPLGLRVLGLLLEEPERMHSSAELAETLGTSAVMVRRLFGALHEAGFIAQKKGPTGGAKLKAHAKGLGLGDLYGAMEPGWLVTGDKALDAVLKRVRADALKAMNETSLGGVQKKMRKQ